MQSSTCPVCGCHVRDGENCPKCGPIVKDSMIARKESTSPKQGKKKNQSQGSRHVTRDGK